MKDWLKRDKAHVWHPFTQMKTAADPILIKRAEGVYLYDENDNSYIDAISSWWVNLHGHCNPYVSKALSEQSLTLEHSIFAGFTHPKAIELSERLCQVLPEKINKVFFSDNGSTSVEVGIKMALQSWWNKGIERPRILAFENAYHGDTFGAMSVGGRSTFFNAFERYLFDVDFIPVPVKGEEEKAIEAFKQKIGEDVAAFIYEPLVQGSAGMVIYDDESLDTMIGIAKDHGVYCIADEVFTGFGRTGMLFASDYLKNKPDIMSLSKGLTAGYMPLGLTVCTDEIYNSFLSDDKSKTFFHGHSYTGNALSCAVACASLDLTLSDEFKNHLERINTSHLSFIDENEGHPLIKNINVKGTILRLEINTGGQTSYFNEMRDAIYNYCIENKVLIRPLGNIVYIVPPTVITNEELQKVYGVLLSLLDYLKQESFL